MRFSKTRRLGTGRASPTLSSVAGAPAMPRIDAAFEAVEEVVTSPGRPGRLALPVADCGTLLGSISLVASDQGEVGEA
jgi:hypothetical protein